MSLNASSTAPKPHNITVNFCLSKDLKIPFKFKILTINGNPDLLNPLNKDPESKSNPIILSKYNQSPSHDLFFSVHVESSSNILTVPVISSIQYNRIVDTSIGEGINSTIVSSSVVSTPVNISKSAKQIELPINYHQLPLNSKLKLIFYNYNLKTGYKNNIGYSELNLFNIGDNSTGSVRSDMHSPSNLDNDNGNCTLKKGHHKLKIHLFDNDKNEISANNNDHDFQTQYSNSDTSLLMDKLEEKLKYRDLNDINTTDWLDQLSFRKIEQINLREQIKKSNKRLKEKNCYVHLELNNFNIPVVFSDSKYATLNLLNFEKFQLNGSSHIINNNNNNNNIDNSNEGIIRGSRPNISTNRSPVFDPDQYRNETSEDPIEFKFRKLERTHHHYQNNNQISPLDRDIKPTLRIRNDISSILKKQFFEKLNQKEKNLIWKFRYFLLNNLIMLNFNKNSNDFNNFIINFIKCIDWSDDYEVNEFLKILNDLELQQRNRIGNIDIANDTLATSTNSTTSISGGSTALKTIANTNNIIPNIFIRELEIVDCLELLNAEYKNHILRNIAIERLKIAKDEDFEMYFVQLISSIKYESDYVNINVDSLSNSDDFNYNYDDIYDLTESTMTNGSNSDYQIIEEVQNNEDPILNFIHNPKLLSSSGIESLKKKLPRLDSPLANLLIQRSVLNPVLTSFFYWDLKVEVDDERARERLTPPPISTPIPTISADLGPGIDSNNTEEPDQFLQPEGLDGATGLVSRNKKTAHNVRPNRSSKRNIFRKTMIHFIMQLASSPDGHEKITSLRNQIDVVSKIHAITLSIKKDYRKETTPKKIEILKLLLSEKKKKRKTHRSLTLTSNSGSNTANGAGGGAVGNNSASNNINFNTSFPDHSSSESLVDFDPIALPLDPSIEVCGVIPEDASVFKSSLTPLKITFKTVNGEVYPIMYKIGDDLRQDQFVTQILTLIEKILLNENLDLKLRPYKILATGPAEGFIQFVPNNSLSSILKKYNNSILTYLQTHNPDPSAMHKVKPEVMDNYVRSCAGYCVVTYLLGVGDRHLENLLLTKDGFFFHVDYGYILGQDPKPFPPLMKLPIQIIEGMGGLDDENYKKFCNYCFISYIILRKNANLILNLFQLMIDSSIPVLKTSAGTNNHPSSAGSVDPDANGSGSASEIAKLEIIWKIQEKFMLDLTDEEAILHFQNLIDDSVNAFLPVVIDRLHSLAQYWRA